MDNDLLTAKKMLDSGNAVILVCNGMVLTNNKGLDIALNEFISSNFDFKEFVLGIVEVNSIISSLIIDLKVKCIITYKLSNIAKEKLENNGIKCSYKELINEFEN